MSSQEEPQEDPAKKSEEDSESEEEEEDTAGEESSDDGEFDDPEDYVDAISDAGWSVGHSKSYRSLPAVTRVTISARTQICVCLWH